MSKNVANKGIAVAVSCIVVGCSIAGVSVQAAQPIQVLTVEQLDGSAASYPSPHPIKRHRRAHHDARADAPKPGDTDGIRKDESGDLIAKLAGGAPVNERGVSSRRMSADARSSGVAAGFYRVNSGDTVAHIATAFGQQARDLMGWNSLTSTSRIQPGQVLRVGPPIEARLRGLTH